MRQRCKDCFWLYLENRKSKTGQSYQINRCAMSRSIWNIEVENNCILFREDKTCKK